MKLFRSFTEAASHEIRSLALGFFDGIHLGHQQVIARALAGDFAANACVLTFDPHPQAVLFPSRAPKLITGLPHKLHDLAALKVPHVLLLPFDQPMMLTSAQQFLQELENSFPHLQQISVGANWRFGHNREGDIPMLQRWCETRRITLKAGNLIQHDAQPISSSRIRDLISSGNLVETSTLLGKPYTLFGTVIQGQQLGRQLGFPTANLETLDQCLPPNGVYRGKVQLDSGKTHSALINIGYKPSIKTATPKITIEAYLLNFSQDLYGQEISVIPEHFQRPEQKFASLEDLKHQVLADIAAVQNNS